MLKKIILFIVTILVIILGVKTTVLIGQVNKLNQAFELRGQISTNKGLTMIHEIDKDDDLIQKFHLKVLNQDLATIELIRKDQWLISLENMDQYLAIESQVRTIETSDIVHLYWYWIKHLHFRRGHFVLDLKQNDIEGLYEQMTGQVLRNSLNDFNENLSYEVFEGQIDFEKDYTEILITVDSFAIGAKYEEGENLSYHDKPILEFESIEPLLNWFGALYERTQ